MIPAENAPIRTLIVDDERLARATLRSLLDADPEIDVAGECKNGREAVASIRESAPDLVFLDVQIPGCNGFEVLEQAGVTRAPVVVFVTAYNEHALRAFELAAVDYLLKPISKERLRHSLARVRARRAPAAEDAQAVLSRMESRPQRMAVREGAKFVVFDTERITAILAQDHYAAILVDGRELLSEESLDRLMSRLDSKKFLRVHRGAIVNVALVQELQHEGDRKYFALLAGLPGTRIPISRDRLEDLKGRLGID